MCRAVPRLVCWLVCWLACLLVGWMVSRLVGLECLHLARSFAKLASFGIYCFTQPALYELLGLPSLLCFALRGLIIRHLARSLFELCAWLSHL